MDREGRLVSSLVSDRIEGPPEPEVTWAQTIAVPGSLGKDCLYCYAFLFIFLSQLYAMK